jgi:16S rRNA (adenine1518-N6/adenine1519-N6)-dimethyltransferase
MPSKRLGQHFLKERGLAEMIVQLARFDRRDRVLEIGPGWGALTLPLAASVHQVLAVEKDARLAEALGKRLHRVGIDNVRVVRGDILRLDLADLLGSRTEEKIRVIGNLPYNISSPLIERLIGHRDRVSRATLMFQAELARRLIAVPGSRAYGAMTVLIQYEARLSSLLEVPKSAFHPRPKVDSMVLSLDFERPHPRRAENEAFFRRVVRGAFAHRRKTLLNCLKRSLPSCAVEDILRALQTCGVEPHRRAETLHIDDYLCLSASLESLA